MTRANKSSRARRRPLQLRSKQTVEWMLEAAARVFRAEGLDATTNRIAAAAGVGIGSLYEYFPNKQALLYALAERHVVTAEHGVEAALAAASAGGPAAAPNLLAELQQAIVASHRYPSAALARATDPRAPELRVRVQALRGRILAALRERARAAQLPDPELRARTAFGLLGELSSQCVHELPEPEQPALLQHLLRLAEAQLART